MPGQNINNYNFNKLDARLSEQKYFDITLSSDKDGYDSEVIFSKKVIGEDNSTLLPINIDLNSALCNQKDTLSWGNFYSGNTLISKTYYNPNNIDISCETATTLCDIGLTATDNGLYDKMTGESLTFTMGINEDEKFNPHYYDRRFKMHPVTGFTSSPNHRFSGNTKQTLYSIVSKENNKVGYYNELYGGFYQGFYKLFGYDYEVFPERLNKGWTSELLLKPRYVEEFSATTNQTFLNDVYSDNSGTFFFIGTRSENKYYHPASGSPQSDSGYTRVTSILGDCLKTCACSDTGVTNSDCINVYPQTATTTTHRTGNCTSYSTSEDVKLQDPDQDLFSNALSVRFSGDGRNPKICVKYIKFTGDCVTTGTCENTGLTYSSGYTIVETCTTKGIYDDCGYEKCKFSSQEQWLMVSTVFERYTTIDGCDLLNWGGLGDVREELYPSEIGGASYNLIMPPQTHEGSNKEKIRSYINPNWKWFENNDKRLGTLKVYVNGYLFLEIEDFEEIIPHELNTEKEKQLGVPFNISIGGGTQGLRESLIPSGCTIDSTDTPTDTPLNSPLGGGPEGPYIQDPELMPNETLSGTSLSGLTTDIIMEPNFAGSFMGGISQFRMYTEPLTFPQIQHNFRVLKDRFELLDFWCTECVDCNDCRLEVTAFADIPITPTPTPTTTITPTITPTPSITSTVSVTPTPSITSTVSVTPTPSITSTVSVTPTPSTTAAASITPTPSITSTPSVTPSITSTVSVTPTPSITPSVTSSVSVTPTPSTTSAVSTTPTPTTTPTSSVTSTPSVTVTPSITPTSSVTPTPSITSSVSLTPTPSITSTSSVTPTPSITPTVSVTVTPTSSPVSSLTPTPTVTPSTTPTPSVSITPSVTSSITPTPSVSITPSITASVTPTPSVSITPSVTSSITPTPSVSITPSVTSSITPTPSVSITPSVTSSITPTPSVTSTVTPTPSTTWIGVQMKDCCTDEVVGAFNVLSDSIIGDSIFYNGSCIYYAVNFGAPSPLNPYLILDYDDCDACELDHPCPSVSATPTMSVTQTPSTTPTITPTQTVTQTPSVTNTVTPTSTPTITPTPSITLSQTVTPTQTQTPTPTPSLCHDCPDGYTWTPVDSETCQVTLVTGATAPSSPYTVSAQTYQTYSELGTRIYNTTNFPTNGSGSTTQYTFLNSPSNTLWRNASLNTVDGPLNRCAIWTDQESGGNWLPTGKWIGFTDCLTGLFDGKTYYVGIAGDNHFRLRLDGDIIVDTRETNSPYLPSNDRAFKIWNVYPVVIGSGDHNLELFGYNNSSFAGFGCEIYDNTFEELTGATSLSDINIIYSTSGQTSFTIVQNTDGSYDSEGYTCPDGYQYSACEDDCVQTLTCSGDTIV